MKKIFRYIILLIGISSNALYGQDDSSVSKPMSKLKLSPLALLAGNLVTSFELPLSAKSSLQVDIGEIFRPFSFQYSGEAVKTEYRFYFNKDEDNNRFYIAPQIMGIYTNHHEDRVIGYNEHAPDGRFGMA